jgi:hypothetical protein
LYSIFYSFSFILSVFLCSPFFLSVILSLLLSFSHSFCFSGFLAFFLSHSLLVNEAKKGMAMPHAAAATRPFAADVAPIVSPEPVTRRSVIEKYPHALKGARRTEKRAGRCCQAAAGRGLPVNSMHATNMRNRTRT